MLLKQILINNGHTNTEFDNELKTFLLKKDSPPPNNNINNINIYYANQMSPSYKISEKILKNMLKITHSVLMIMKNLNSLFTIKAN